jgi:hypothetical protein
MIIAAARTRFWGVEFDARAFPKITCTFNNRGKIFENSATDYHPDFPMIFTRCTPRCS